MLLHHIIKDTPTMLLRWIAITTRECELTRLLLKCRRNNYYPCSTLTSGCGIAYSSLYHQSSVLKKQRMHSLVALLLLYCQLHSFPFVSSSSVACVVYKQLLILQRYSLRNTMHISFAHIAPFYYTICGYWAPTHDMLPDTPSSIWQPERLVQLYHFSSCCCMLFLSLFCESLWQTVNICVYFYISATFNTVSSTAGFMAINCTILPVVPIIPAFLTSGRFRVVAVDVVGWVVDSQA